jgi:hypothetical protein
MIKGDIGRMANCAISLLGPLPPIDVEGVRHEFEKIYAEAVYAMKSNDAEWWEKSAAQGWLRFLEVARQFHIPAGVDTIQFFRTTFAYDTVIMRLHKDLDVTKEWEAYAKEAAKEARQRVQKGMHQRRFGPTDMDYVQMEEFGDMLRQIIFQLQQNIENPIVRFRNIVGKIAYVVSLMLKVGVLIAGAIALGFLADAVSKRWFGYDINWSSIWEQTTTFGWVQFILITTIFVIARRIIIRMNAPDTRLDPER